MFKQKSLLNFFIEQQKKLTQIQKLDFSLQLKKEQAESLITKNKLNFNFKLKIENLLQKNEFSQNFVTIPNYVTDSEFSSFFNTKTISSDDILINEIYSLFTSPLQENCNDFLLYKNDDCMVFRSGFFSDEYDLYESMLLGFDGMVVYSYGMDKYKIQLLTEIARDYHFTLMFIVHNKQEIREVLETDAPYIAISGFNPKTFEVDFSHFVHLSQYIPKTTNLIAWSGYLDNSKKIFLKDIGYKVVFELN
ncbi:hypothetical protein [Spirobacillus cienkowskii]|jgi:hypothetical protein|uniref:hypothetical protein n=1 Tax=Spirobacillus cienkowskii TaxID=495820 RepID=UPI0030D081DF